MRVAHVTISHGPFDIRVFHREARTLAAAGYDVHVLTPWPAPPATAGVTFHALPDIGPHAYFWRVWRHAWTIYRRSRAVGAAVYHIPDPSLIPVALVLKLRGAKVVYDAHEDRPRQARTKYHERPVVGWVSSLLWLALEAVAKLAFDAIVAATPAIARRFPKRKTVTVRNLALLEEFDRDGAGSPRPYREREKRIVYTGALNLHRGIRQLVEAVDFLPDELDAELVLIGDFERAHPGFEAELRRLPGWRRVRYLGWCERPQMLAELDAARVGAVLLQPRPEHREALPNKLLEYMGAGLPIVASHFPLWRTLVEGNGAGVTVDPTHPRAIADTFERLLSEPAAAEAMGRRGSAAVRREYNWESERGPLLELYARLTQPSRSSEHLRRQPA